MAQQFCFIFLIYCDKWNIFSFIYLCQKYVYICTSYMSTSDVSGVGVKKIKKKHPKDPTSFKVDPMYLLYYAKYSMWHARSSLKVF